MCFWRENCGSLFLTVKPRFKLSDPTILFGSYLNNTLLHFFMLSNPRPTSYLLLHDSSFA
ncbi:hypothetical protein HanXRQr2_Chr02g0058621 [Helianthus annuus]|uniref:Uncharacterized protein n=1 Tax=Helianthus annuus TaxID=4232 RepID=A0A251VE94_HELAN|nr:hypothetical protein HanXRQr2_Chr02g0058621 [Helianthus annuus]KAJ0618338.1 hypothetical protein HanHA89_Chr02g0052041 [Helianthus annuus]